MLSSDTEQITPSSLGFQEKSEILAVCPPWMNYREEERGGGGLLQHLKNAPKKLCTSQTHQQLRRAILSILWRLLLSNLTEVPDIESPVCAAGGQDGFIMRRPLNLVESTLDGCYTFATVWWSNKNYKPMNRTKTTKTGLTANRQPVCSVIIPANQALQHHITGKKWTTMRNGQNRPRFTTSWSRFPL